MRPAFAHYAVIEPCRQVAACGFEIVGSLAFAGLMHMNAMCPLRHAFSCDLDMHSAGGSLEHGDFSPDSVTFKCTADTVSLGGIGAAGG